MYLLCVGDSYASKVGNKKNWLDILNIPTDFRHGIPGSTALDWKEDKKQCLTNAMAVVSNMVLISLLGNDALKVNKSKKINVNSLVSNAIDNLSYVINKIKRDETLVFLYADPFFGKNSYTKKSIPIVNKAIKEACSPYNITFVDLGEILDKQCFDGKNVHPNENGQKKIATYLRKLLIPF